MVNNRCSLSLGRWCRTRGAEIAAVCREAAMHAIERVADKHGSAAVDHADEVLVRSTDFDAALNAVSPAGT